MSTNGNVWKPRRSEKWICPSGQEVWTRQPGPEFTLRLGRTPHRFSGNGSMPERREGQTDEQYAQQVLDNISDDDLVASARELLVAMMETPKLVLNPNYEAGEIGPDDTGMDFWPLYQYGMEKYFKHKGPIQVGGGEVEASDLETFPEQPGVSGDSVDGIHLSMPEAESDPSNSGLGHSAGS